jgi:hypothetical protein
MSWFEVEGSATNFVNGQLVSVTAKGKGSVEEGVVGLDWGFSSEVVGFPQPAMMVCTSFGVSLTCAIERNGGLNMLSLSRGNYRMYRVMNFGRYGSYDLRSEIRTSGQRITAKGVTVGSMQLPQTIAVPSSLVEVMFQAGPREIRSFMSAILTDKDGTKIHVAIPTVYSPLTEDEEDWTRKAGNQIRRSFVKMKREGGKLAIEHATIIEGVKVPSFPTSGAFEGAN